MAGKATEIPKIDFLKGTKITWCLEGKGARSCCCAVWLNRVSGEAPGSQYFETQDQRDATGDGASERGEKKWLLHAQRVDLLFLMCAVAKALEREGILTNCCWGVQLWLLSVAGKAGWRRRY